MWPDYFGLYRMEKKEPSGSAIYIPKRKKKKRRNK